MSEIKFKVSESFKRLLESKLSGWEEKQVNGRPSANQLEKKIIKIAKYLELKIKLSKAISQPITLRTSKVYVFPSETRLPQAVSELY